MKAATTAGTADWTLRTGGRLAPAEQRRLVADLAASTSATLPAG